MKTGMSGLDGLSPVEKSRWLAKGSWTLREFAMLCCGWNPDWGEIPDKAAYDEARTIIEAGVASGELKTIISES